MSSDELSFIATMSICNYPVTLAGNRLTTQWMKTAPTRFYFKYFHGFYNIQIASGEHAGACVDVVGDGYLVAAKDGTPFLLQATTKAYITLAEIVGDQKAVYLQTPRKYYVQQCMYGGTAFEDHDTMYNFLLAVPRVDRGDGKYLAMEENSWVARSAGYPDRTIPADITLHIEQKGVS
ncbi:hypothetical protein [Pseudomonas sp. H3(2019)]|uniref:hypothetical protein n=1 Tax=Pseudomonas sp. H3(2019) TaxID=2598724 RepID=UPI001197B435|nr:hypothetical protein [Pseudomonas sp. H3(2019)]TVT79667.1 hypothetical protein FPT12_25665 [Pseudomonas sp. H3(2019)]